MIAAQWGCRLRSDSKSHKLCLSITWVRHQNSLKLFQTATLPGGVKSITVYFIQLKYGLLFSELPDKQVWRSILAKLWAKGSPSGDHEVGNLCAICSKTERETRIWYLIFPLSGFHHNTMSSSLSIQQETPRSPEAGSDEPVRNRQHESDYLWQGLQLKILSPQKSYYRHLKECTAPAISCIKITPVSIKDSLFKWMFNVL